MHDAAGDLQFRERHGNRSHYHHPLHAQAQESSVPQIHVHRFDQDASCQKARHHDAHQNYKDGGTTYNRTGAA
jgi:hypothetical protein